MRILVIGGTGVLSHAIASSAVRAGHEVTIVTNGRGLLPQPDGVRRHLLVDRQDAPSLTAALRSVAQPDWDLVVDAICYRETDAAVICDLIGGQSHHTVVISSAILYDRSAPQPFRPDSPLAATATLGAYGKGKAGIERIWSQAWIRDGHPVTIFRLPHILGRGCEFGAVPLHNRDPGLVSRISNARPVFLADGGRQVFQTVHNEDVARVILASCGKRRTFGQIYNCANSELLTGLNYCEILADLIGMPLTVREIPANAVQDSGWGWDLCSISRVLDLTSLREDIGTIPGTPIRESMHSALAFLIEHRNARSREPGTHLAPLETRTDEKEPGLAFILAQCATHRPSSPIDQRMNA